MNKSPAWSALENHYHDIKDQHLNNLFNNDIQRGKRFCIQNSGIYFDYSKNHLTNKTLELLFNISKEKKLKEKINNLFSGEKVNGSENRAALHTALRDPNNINGINSGLHASIQKAQANMFSLLGNLESGCLQNRHDLPFKHLVCLGIGGSYLGPKFVVDALKHTTKNQNIKVSFIANIDPAALENTLSNINIEDCLFFIASKSFNTLETLENANHIKQQLKQLGLSQHEITKHFIASTENKKGALSFGCLEENILPVWDFIGGRYSLWSTIGFPIAAALGKESFLDLLSGAHQMDRHFIESDFEKNMPIILASISIWYQCFFKAPSRAVIPYSHHLKTLPAFLQQLEMESLGKHVTQDNKLLDHDSGAIIWGSEGTNSQHSFHQLLHQGTHLIPCDFLITKSSPSNQPQHDKLFAQCIAQSRALMIGNDSHLPEKQHEGNRPSNTFIMDGITPTSLGALLAMYEHKTFVQSVLLNINPFDQWGVELGKIIGNEIEKALTKQTNLDSSSEGLIKYYKD